MKLRTKVISLLVALVSGAAGVFLLRRWSRVLLDHPRGYGDLLVLLVCGVMLVIASLSTLVLTWQFAGSKAFWARIALIAARGVASIFGVVGLAIGTASGLNLFGRSTDHLIFHDRVTWYVGLLLGTCFATCVTFRLLYPPKPSNRRGRRRAQEDGGSHPCGEKNGKPRTAPGFDKHAH